MKRIILGLLAAFLTMTGLVAVTSSPASAACPYTNCIQTAASTSGPAKITPGKAAIRVGVRSAGNVYPEGTVTMTIYRKGRPGVIYSATNRLAPAEPYVARTRFTTRFLKAGVYNLVFRYIPASDTVFKASKSNRTLTVVRG